MTNSLIVVVLIVIFVSTVAGCAIIGSSPEPGRLTIQYSVVVSTKGDPDRAKAIRDWAEGLELSGKVTLGELTASLRGSDDPIIDDLLDIIRDELETQFWSGALKVDDRVSLKTVKGWIHEAANRAHTARL